MSTYFPSPVHFLVPRPLLRAPNPSFVNFPISTLSRLLCLNVVWLSFGAWRSGFSLFGPTFQSRHHLHLQAMVLILTGIKTPA